MAGTVIAISSARTMRPPYLSVQMPSGTRISDPVNTGMAVSRPNSVALRPSVFLIGMPITANIIQTMKHTVNANVLTISTERACPFLVMPEGSFNQLRTELVRFGRDLSCKVIGWVTGLTLGRAGLWRYPPEGLWIAANRAMQA